MTREPQIHANREPIPILTGPSLWQGVPTTRIPESLSPQDERESRVISSYRLIRTAHSYAAGTEDDAVHTSHDTTLEMRELQHIIASALKMLATTNRSARMISFRTCSSTSQRPIPHLDALLCPTSETIPLSAVSPINDEEAAPAQPALLFHGHLKIIVQASPLSKEELALSPSLYVTRSLVSNKPLLTLLLS